MNGMFTSVLLYAESPNSYQTRDILRTFALEPNVMFLAFAIVRTSIHVTLSTV